MHARRTTSAFRHSALAGACVLATCLLATGCRSSPTSAPPAPPADLAAAGAAMLPTQLIIHPLTRVSTDTAGKPALLIYLELRDQYGQVVKALGQVRVELMATGSLLPGSGRDARAERIWDIDLRDPNRNALLFDGLITRTYALTLGDLPDWMVAWSESGGQNAGPTVNVTFTLFAADRPEGRTELQAETRLTK